MRFWATMEEEDAYSYGRYDARFGLDNMRYRLGSYKERQAYMQGYRSESIEEGERRERSRWVVVPRLQESDQPRATEVL